MGGGFLAKVSQIINITKRGVLTPVVKAVVYANEVINAERFGPSGDDSPPLPADIALLVANERLNGRSYIGVIDQSNPPLAEAGEKRLYARDSDGNLVGYVWLKGDGALELLSDADNAVRYSALATAFNQLKQDFDTHNHPTAPSGPVSTPSTAPSSADITGSKIDEIKVP